MVCNERLNEMVTVNCMGPFPLTNLLSDLLKKSTTEEKPSLVVNLSSRVLGISEKEWVINLDDIITEKSVQAKHMDGLKLV